MADIAENYPYISINQSTGLTGEDKNRPINSPDGVPYIDISGFGSRDFEKVSSIKSPYSTETISEFGPQIPLGATENELRYQRADRQPWYQQFANSLGQAVIGEGIGGTLQGFGYLGDVAKTVDTIEGTNQDFGNLLVDWGKGIRTWSEEAMPIYTKQQGGWHPEDSGWWAKNFVSIGSTLGLLIPAGAVGKGISALGKFTKLLSESGKIASWATEATTMALTSRHMENMMEASQTFDETYRDLKARGIPDATAKQEAGKAASNTYIADYAMLAQDMLQYGFLLRAPKISTKAFSPSVARAMGKSVPLVYGKVAAGIALDMAGEGFEEGYQQVVQNESKHMARVHMGLEKDTPFYENLKTYAQDSDVWTNALFGALGAGVFQTVGHSAMEAITGDGKKQKKYDEARIKEFKDREERITHLRKRADEAAEAGDKDAYHFIQNTLMPLEIGMKAASLGNMDSAIKTFESHMAASPEEMAKLGIDEEYKKNIPNVIRDLKSIGKYYDEASLAHSPLVVDDIVRTKYLIDKLGENRQEIKGRISELELKNSLANDKLTLTGQDILTTKTTLDSIDRQLSLNKFRKKYYLANGIGKNNRLISEIDGAIKGLEQRKVNNTKKLNTLSNSYKEAGLTEEEKKQDSEYIDLLYKGDLAKEKSRLEMHDEEIVNLNKDLQKYKTPEYEQELQKAYDEHKTEQEFKDLSEKLSKADKIEDIERDYNKIKDSLFYKNNEKHAKGIDKVYTERKGQLQKEAIIEKEKKDKTSEPVVTPAPKPKPVEDIPEDTRVSEGFSEEGDLLDFVGEQEAKKVIRKKEETEIPIDKDDLNTLTKETDVSSNKEEFGDGVRKKTNILTGARQDVRSTGKNFIDQRDENGKIIVNKDGDPLLFSSTAFNLGDELEIFWDKDYEKQEDIANESAPPKRNVNNYAFAVRRKGADKTAFYVHKLNGDSETTKDGIDSNISRFIYEEKINGKRSDINLRIEQKKLEEFRAILARELVVRKRGTVGIIVNSKSIGHILENGENTTTSFEAFGKDSRVTLGITQRDGFASEPEDKSTTIRKNVSMDGMKGYRPGGVVVWLPTLNREEGKVIHAPFQVAMDTISRVDAEHIYDLLNLSNNQIKDLNLGDDIRGVRDLLDRYFIFNKQFQVKNGEFKPIGRGEGFVTKGVNIKTGREEIIPMLMNFHYNASKKLTIDSNSTYPILEVVDGKVSIKETIPYKEWLLKHTITNISSDTTTDINGNEETFYFVQPNIGFDFSKEEKETLKRQGKGVEEKITKEKKGKEAVPIPASIANLIGNARLNPKKAKETAGSAKDTEGKTTTEETKSVDPATREEQEKFCNPKGKK